MSNIKGFITDINNNTILPITRGELVLDELGEVALHSSLFAANEYRYGLLSKEHYKVLASLGSTDNLDENSLAVILARLTAINDGIKVGTTQLHFYDENNQGTPITFNSSETISLKADNNNITASLIPLPQDPTTTENVVANVTVDLYGRVTLISPTTALSGVNLTGCITNDVTDNTSNQEIVNKKYVDDKFSDISAISTGALKFEGPIGNNNNIANLLKEDSYYLASAPLNLLAELVHGADEQVSVKVGDTLIAHKMDGVLKFTIIPSGDDKTIINLSDSSSDHNTTTIGVGISNIKFASPFTLTNDTNSTTIAIPEADTNTAGIISAELYREITLATAKSMSYEQLVVGGLTIGQIKIGDGTENPIEILIPNYSLQYDNNAIKWSGYANETLNIQFGGGLQPTYSDSTYTVNVNLGENNKYLKVNDNGVLTAVISEVDTDSKFTPGLIDNKLFLDYTTILATAAYYKSISRSLNDDLLEDDEKTLYKYGSEDLMNAIRVTI